MRIQNLAIAAACAAFVGGCASAGSSSPPLRLLDAHTHLMVEILGHDEEIALLRKAGLDRVLLMHPVPEELAAMADKYPGFVIPSVNARVQVPTSRLGPPDRFATGG